MKSNMVQGIKMKDGEKLYKRNGMNLKFIIKKVADFYSVTLTDEQVKTIAGESTFSVMQKNPVL